MRLGISYTGLVMLALPFLPNLVWTRYKPEGYDRYVGNENRILRCLERIGEISASGLSSGAFERRGLRCPIVSTAG